MILGKKIVVVLPAYNAEKTLARTVGEIPAEVADTVILVDDASADRTAALAAELGVEVIRHPENLGYGGNQKTCYRAALEHGADIVVMIHPDYQYTPKLAPALCSVIACGEFDVALGSRILGVGALRGGMPFYKYVANRLLTLFQNLMLGHKLSEYHTGYRAFSRDVLLSLPLAGNSDDFLFDNQMLAQVIMRGYRIAEISCPCRYQEESSSINFRRSTVYGLGVIWTSLLGLGTRLGLCRPSLFREDAPKPAP